MTKQSFKRGTTFEIYQIKSNQIQSNPIQSNPIQSNPIQSNPIQSNPIQSNPCNVYNLLRLVKNKLISFLISKRTCKVILNKAILKNLGKKQEQLASTLCNAPSPNICWQSNFRQFLDNFLMSFALLLSKQIKSTL